MRNQYSADIRRSMALSASLPKTRLYVILARKSPVAVVFRRGPSKQVLMLSWNTESHEFRVGRSGREPRGEIIR
jgi:hypothetical protein